MWEPVGQPTPTLKLNELSSATRGAHPEFFYSAFRFASAMTALPTTLCFTVCEQQSRLAKQVWGLGCGWAWACGRHAMDMRARSRGYHGGYAVDVRSVDMDMKTRRRASTAEALVLVAGCPIARGLREAARPAGHSSRHGTHTTSAAETSPRGGWPHIERQCIRANDERSFGAR